MLRLVLNDMSSRAISGSNQDVLPIAIVTENTSIGGIGRYCLSLAENLKSYPDVQVRLVAPYEKTTNAPLVLCSSCGETHPATDGDLCIRCSGKENYYEVSMV